MSPLCGARPAAETLALNTLMKEQKGRYQICGVNAFRIKQLLSREITEINSEDRLVEKTFGRYLLV